jgi:glycosyltransferase involved in cell wall biosynthesis
MGIAELTASFEAVPPPAPLPLGARPRAAGKFLFAGGEKLAVRGVTYGTFAGSEECSFPERRVVESDFAAMAAAGVNAVRTYVAPPPWLLDLAGEYGLRVLVGLPWTQHVTFLDDRRQARAIIRGLEADAAPLAGHPALLGFAVGNEIPTSIVRWHGPRRIASFLGRTYSAIKDLDPEGLVTYANYPSSEYLELPFLDFVSFNVYLEDPRLLADYLPRLQNVAGDRPLVLTELGLDSRRNGLETQARVIEQQLGAAFDAGCAGTFVFAWTDEWHRNGREVDDWDFGLTDRERTPKPALFAVRDVYTSRAIGEAGTLPRISVVICSHNGAKTLRDCLAGVAALDYPDYECIVVDDGSTDATPAIAQEFGAQLIQTGGTGLSVARNLGLEASTGEIVAYIDDDTVPDTEWLRYLACAFRDSTHAAIGGPNLSLPDRALVEDSVGRSPGNPTHVLLTDQTAEHIPGCNMAFRRAALAELGGFDARFRVAGDDVDVCWRVQERGWTLGFHAGAVVWHRRRGSVRAFLKQQIGYGRAEGMLARKWPEKYNSRGHPRWAGYVYDDRPRNSQARRWNVYYGVWGSAPFQHRTGTHARLTRFVPAKPDWYLLVAGLALWSVYGFVDHPLVLRVPGLGWPISFLVLIVVLTGLLASGGRHGWAAVDRRVTSRRRRTALRTVSSSLHVLQPLARLVGRIGGERPWWGIRIDGGSALPRLHRRREWSERWQALEERIAGIERELLRRGVVVARGGAFDRWDLEAAAGALGAARLRVAVEEHGGGKQLFRYRVVPRPSAPGLVLLALLIAFTIYSLLNSLTGGLAVGVLVLLVGWKAAADCTASTAHVLHALDGEAAQNDVEGHALRAAFSDEPALLLVGADGGE